jgi:hypothetical protein
MIDLFSEPRILLCSLNGGHPNGGSSLDPEDFKGLFEWVTAKRIEEIKTKEDYHQVYSAPWRIG